MTADHPPLNDPAIIAAAVSSGIDRPKLLADLHFSLVMALGGVGEFHPSRGRRSPYRLPLDFADVVAPRLVDRMTMRGWQFRHFTWVPGVIIGDPDGRAWIGHSTP